MRCRTPFGNPCSGTRRQKPVRYRPNSAPGRTDNHPRSSFAPPLFAGAEYPRRASLTTKTVSTLTEYRLDALGAERQVAQAAAGGIGEGVGNCGRHRPLRGFAGTERLLDIPVDQGDEDFRRFRYGQDRIAAPIARGDAVAVEADGFVQGPAGRLDHATLDLVRQPVEVDDLARISGGESPRHPDPSALAVDSTSATTATQVARFLYWAKAIPRPRTPSPFSPAFQPAL